MPALPNTPSPVVRISCKWTGGNAAFGARFFMGYSGSLPNNADLNTFATAVSSSYSSQMAPHISAEWVLVELDIREMSSSTGASGLWTGTIAGTQTGSPVAANTCQLMLFSTARHYRGGKPRIYLPAGGTAAIFDEISWTAAQQTAMNASWTGWMSGIIAAAWSGTSNMQQVMVGYYSGVYPPVTLPSGRVKQANKPLATPVVTPISGHNLRLRYGTQRRRIPR